MVRWSVLVVFGVFSLQLVIILYEWIWVNLDKGCYHWSFILAPISSASLSKMKTENIFIHILPVTQNLKGLLLWSQSMSNSKQLCLNFKKMKYKVLHCEWDQSHRCRKEEVLFGKKTHKTIFVFQLTMSLLGCGFKHSHCILDFLQVEVPRHKAFFSLSGELVKVLKNSSLSVLLQF